MDVLWLFLRRSCISAINSRYGFHQLFGSNGPLLDLNYGAVAGSGNSGLLGINDSWDFNECRPHRAGTIGLSRHACDFQVDKFCTFGRLVISSLFGTGDWIFRRFFCCAIVARLLCAAEGEG